VVQSISRDLIQRYSRQVFNFSDCIGSKWSHLCLSNRMSVGMISQSSFEHHKIKWIIDSGQSVNQSNCSSSSTSQKMKRKTEANNSVSLIFASLRRKRASRFQWKQFRRLTRFCHQNTRKQQRRLEMSSIPILFLQNHSKTQLTTSI